MKKKKALSLLLAAILMIFAGCAKKTSAHISVDGIGSYQVTQIPDGLENFAINDDVIDVTVKKDGVYSFVLEGENGQEYSFSLTYHDGNAEVSSEDAMSLSLGVE